MEYFKRGSVSWSEREVQTQREWGAESCYSAKWQIWKAEGVVCNTEWISCRTQTLFFSWKHWIFYTDDISEEYLTPTVSSLKKQSSLTPVTVGMNCYETLILALLSNRIFQNNLKHKHLVCKIILQPSVNLTLSPKHQVAFQHHRFNTIFSPARGKTKEQD